MDLPSRRSWLARSAAAELGEGLMRLTRSAIRIELKAWRVIWQGRYRGTEAVAKTSSFWLYSERLWIGTARTMGCAAR